MALNGRLYYNRKSGDIYSVICEAIDATNARDGNKVVVYMNCAGLIFVRDLAEFNEKFNVLPRTTV